MAPQPPEPVVTEPPEAASLQGRRRCHVRRPRSPRGVRARSPPSSHAGPDRQTTAGALQRIRWATAAGRQASAPRIPRAPGCNRARAKGPHQRSRFTGFELQATPPRPEEAGGAGGVREAGPWANQGGGQSGQRAGRRGERSSWRLEHHPQRLGAKRPATAGEQGVIAAHRARRDESPRHQQPARQPVNPLARLGPLIHWLWRVGEGGASHPQTHRPQLEHGPGGGAAARRWAEGRVQAAALRSADPPSITSIPSGPPIGRACAGILGNQDRPLPPPPGRCGGDQPPSTAGGGAARGGQQGSQAHHRCPSRRVSPGLDAGHPPRPWARPASGVESLPPTSVPSAASNTAPPADWGVRAFASARQPLQARSIQRCRRSPVLFALDITVVATPASAHDKPVAESHGYVVFTKAAHDAAQDGFKQRELQLDAHQLRHSLTT